MKADSILHQSVRTLLPPILHAVKRQCFSCGCCMQLHTTATPNVSFACFEECATRRFCTRHEQCSRSCTVRFFKQHRRVDPSGGFDLGLHFCVYSFLRAQLPHCALRICRDSMGTNGPHVGFTIHIDRRLSLLPELQVRGVLVDQLVASETFFLAHVAKFVLVLETKLLDHTFVGLSGNRDRRHIVGGREKNSCPPNSPGVTHVSKHRVASHIHESVAHVGSGGAQEALHADLSQPHSAQQAHGLRPG